MRQMQHNPPRKTEKISKIVGKKYD